VLILLVFVAVRAPRSAVAWAALVLGFLIDLKPLPMPNELADVALIGPGCLGYLAGGFVVVHLRSMVFRESSLTLAAMVLVAGVFAHLIMVALLTMRGLPWPLGEPVHGWDVADQLAGRFMEVVYTAGCAVPVGTLLRRLTPLWGFAPHAGPARRAASARAGR
jgi:hypothetical protein